MYNITFNEKQANNIYSILTKHGGASEKMRDAFVYEYTKEEPSSEWRFSGKLGCGGKFRLTHNNFYVEYYLEDESTDKNKIVDTINKKLKKI